MESARRWFLFGCLGALWAPTAFAGAGFLYVTNRSDKTCPALTPVENSESRAYFLSTEETIEVLKNYFADKPNRDLMDAVLVNAGIKFCGNDEKAEIRKFVLSERAKPNPPRKVIEVTRNYFREKEPRR